MVGDGDGSVRPELAHRRGRKRSAMMRKEQGRWRSIPPTTLPAPDIEIGLRPSGGCSLARLERIRCDLSHNGGKKVHGFVSQTRLPGGLINLGTWHACGERSLRLAISSLAPCCEAVVRTRRHDRRLPAIAAYLRAHWPGPTLLRRAAWFDPAVRREAA